MAILWLPMMQRKTIGRHKSSKPGSRDAFWSKVRVREQPALMPSPPIRASANDPCPSLIKRDHGGKHFLFACYNENVSLERALDRGGDRVVRKTIGAVEHPYGLRHHHNTEESGVLLGQLLLDQLPRLWRLDGIVLREVADKDVGIEPDHRRLARGATPATPAAAAAAISSIVTGRCRRGLTMPRKAEAGIFGNRTTLPSGCTKNLTLSPGFNRRWSRMGLGIVAWPLAVIADSMVISITFCQM